MVNVGAAGVVGVALSSEIGDGIGGGGVRRERREEREVGGGKMRKRGKWGGRDAEEEEEGSFEEGRVYSVCSCLFWTHNGRGVVRRISAWK